MKKFTIAAFGAALLFPFAGAVAAPYDTIAAMIDSCETISAPGPMGDYIVQCDPTDDLVQIASAAPAGRFLSAGISTDVMNKVQDGEILINVLPVSDTLGGDSGCYRVMTTDADINALPTDDTTMWAVQVCPSAN